MMKRAGMDFWTPIQFDSQLPLKHQPTSLLSKVAILAESYLALGDRVAKVSQIRPKDQWPPQNKTTLHLCLEERKAPLWQTTLKVASYATIILPLLALILKTKLRSQFYLEVVKQTFSDTIQEQGQFDSEGILKKGVRAENGEKTFLRPEFLIFENCSEPKLNFTKDPTTGKVVAIQKVEGANSIPYQYTLYSGSMEEAILKKRLDNNGYSLDQLLPITGYDHKEFATYLSTLGAKTHDFSSPSSILIELFSLMKKHSLDIKPLLLIPDPKDRKTVLDKHLWNPYFIEQLLKIDPSLMALELSVDRPLFERYSLFGKAIYEGHSKTADFLWENYIQRQPSERDLWIQKARTGDTTDMTPEAFSKLPRHLKLKVLRTANIYVRIDFLEKCTSAKETQVAAPLFKPENPGDLLSYDMDATEAVKAIRSFCQTLRKSGHLITLQELQNLKTRASYNSLLEETDVIPQILEMNRLKEIATTSQIAIQFPDQIAVIDPGPPLSLSELSDPNTVHFRIARNNPMQIDSTTLKLLTGKIYPCHRSATKEEITALFDFIKQTAPENFSHFYCPVIGMNREGVEKIYLKKFREDNQEDSQIKRFKQFAVGPIIFDGGGDYNALPFISETHQEFFSQEQSKCRSYLEGRKAGLKIEKAISASRGNKEWIATMHGYRSERPIPFYVLSLDSLIETETH